MAQSQRHAQVTITNRPSRGNLKFVPGGDKFAPDTILQDNSAFFVTKTSEGYVTYDGTNVQGGPSNCAWLLAWNVLGFGNQVYVTCGPKESILAIPVDEIYKRVEASKSSSTYVDTETKTTATAAIDAIADTPQLGCQFTVYH